MDLACKGQGRSPSQRFRFHVLSDPLLGWGIGFAGSAYAGRRFAAAACLAGLLQISRRRRWPFHINNPVRTMTGKKTNRVGGAY